MGFVAHHIIYSSVWVLPDGRYSVHEFGYCVGKPDPWITHIEPYLFSRADTSTQVAFD